MKPATGIHLLRALARDYGMQTAYYDAAHRRRTASAETLLGTLRALGAPLDTPEDIPAALRERRRAPWRRRLDPVTVAWDGGPLSLEVRLPSRLAGARLAAELAVEDGGRRRAEWRGSDLPALRSETVEGDRYEVKRFPLDGTLPPGYHRLSLEGADGTAETLVISAPRRAYSPGAQGERRSWGVFLPLYALRRGEESDTPGFAGLEALMEWVAGLGGDVVATLPLLAAFLDDPFDPSPYSPASRLLWNELYLDLDRIPDMATCASARTLLASRPVREELAALDGSPLVDYRRLMALKRRVLESLSRHCFAELPGRAEEVLAFVRERPVVEEYARFRAVAERLHAPWTEWPEPLKSGRVRPGDYDEQGRRYHVYAQWVAHQQMESLALKSRQSGAGLYLDLPLGVHPHGFDVWKEQALFARDVRVGAPPDAFFTRGQDWRFPPMHPERLREQGYRYLIALLRHHLRHAAILRVDHVMGLHRLYWIPPGLGAHQGAYVRYRADELYAVLCLESNRARCRVVGEDLGTVPGYVRAAMARRGLGGMFVVPFEMKADPRNALRPVPRNAVASLNTHDLPTFAAFWRGRDIEDRLGEGLLGAAEAAAERKARESAQRALVALLRKEGYLKGRATPSAVHAACVAHLGAGAAQLVLVNLEDLWLEMQPQNVPGTGQERPNWRRKTRHTFERFSRMEPVLEALRTVDRLRRTSPEGGEEQK